MIKLPIDERFKNVMDNDQQDGKLQKKIKVGISIKTEKKNSVKLLSRYCSIPMKSNQISLVSDYVLYFRLNIIFSNVFYKLYWFGLGWVLFCDLEFQRHHILNVIISCIVIAFTDLQID